MLLWITNSKFSLRLRSSSQSTLCQAARGTSPSRWRPSDFMQPGSQEMLLISQTFSKTTSRILSSHIQCCWYRQLLRKPLNSIGLSGGYLLKFIEIYWNIVQQRCELQADFDPKTRWYLFSTIESHWCWQFFQLLLNICQCSLAQANPISCTMLSLHIKLLGNHCLQC